MDIKILTDEKGVLEIEIASLTLAEVLRAYLVKNGAEMAAWKREHPSKNPVLRIEHDKPKKFLKDVISKMEKEIDSLLTDFKKLK